MGTVTAIVGIDVAIATFRNAWAVDADRNLHAAADLIAGRFGTDHGYLYSPVAAALTVPWTALPHDAAIVLWLVVRLGVLIALIAAATRGWSPTDRIVTFVAAALFVPTLYDLMLGNVSILIAAAVALVAWRRDGLWTGVALGLAVATVPKPQLIPILAWMLVYRRRALMGASVVATLTTAGGLLVLGVANYERWVAVLRSVDYLSSPMYGNLSLFAFLPAPLAIAAAIGAIAGTLFAVARAPEAGLVACVALGLLIAPYTLAYAVVLMLVVARPLAIAAPRATLALGLTASVGVLVALPLWLAAVVATALRVRPSRWAPE